MTDSPTPSAPSPREPEPPSETFPRMGSQFRRTASGDVDIMHAIGGVRGIVEALLPGFLFLVVFLVSTNLFFSLVVAAAVSLVFALVRLVQRTSMIQALSGSAGVIICAVVALRTGEASDYYVPGFWINLGYGIAVLATIIFRRPVLGFIYGFIRDETGSWWGDRQRYRAYRAATWVLCGMFVLRLLVQIPLYLSDNVAALGTARLLMGTPLYAAVLWLTWMMTRKPADTQDVSRH